MTEQLSNTAAEATSQMRYKAKTAVSQLQTVVWDVSLRCFANVLFVLLRHHHVMLMLCLAYAHFVCLICSVVICCDMLTRYVLCSLLCCHICLRAAQLFRSPDFRMLLIE